jgi:hypothetical protein
LWENLLIVSAIEKGCRDENKLTNLVFSRRHPERNDRPLRKEEHAFGTLSAEWLRIRNEIVRPAIARSGVVQSGVDSTMGKVVAARSGSWNQIRTRIVSAARAEWERWDEGRLHERNQKAWPMVGRYWFDGVKYRPKWLKPGIHTRQICVGNPDEDMPPMELATCRAWSAAFICWCVRQALLPEEPEEVFPYAGNHIDYTIGMMHRALTVENYPLEVRRPYEVPPRPGDLVLKWRKTKRTYDDLLGVARKAAHTGSRKPKRKSWTGHADIVVEVESDKIWVIGGNVNQSVSRDDMPITSDGTLAHDDKSLALLRLGPSRNA